MVVRIEDEGYFDDLDIRNFGIGFIQNVGVIDLADYKSINHYLEDFRKKELELLNKIDQKKGE